MSLRLVALLVLLTVCVAAPARAQVLRGRLVDAASGEGVGGGDVVLRGNSLPVRATSDSLGNFELRAPRGGSYSVSVTRIGYLPYISRSFDLNPREIAEVAVRLSSSPINVSALVVTGRRPMALGTLAGFERRRSEGAGYFLTRKDIEARVVATPTTLLLPVAGIILKRGAGARETYRIMFQAPSFGECTASIYLDGVLVPQSSQTLDDWLDLQTIAGVEVYPRRIEVPIEYRRDECGAVLFWTRDGEPGRRSSAKLYIAAGAALATLAAFFAVR